MTDDLRISIENLAPDGSNWVTYRDRMVWTIESRGLTEHLSEASITQDYIAAGTVEHRTPQARWNQDNGIVKRLIGASIPNSVFLQIRSKTNAKDVWDTLKALYETRSELTKINLSQRLQSMKCGEEDNLRTHYDRLNELREQLAALGKTLTNTEYAAIMMGSLLPSYESVLHSIASTAYMQSISITSEVVHKLSTDTYDRRQIENAGKVQDEAFAAEARKKGSKGKKRDIECFNCHKKGHVKAECWAKGGGNEGGGPKKRDKTDGAGKKDEAGQKSAAATAEEAVDEAWATVEVADEWEQDELSPQVAALVAKQKSGAIREVYDSGASRHISPV
jgi:hypothetical protein